VTEGLVSDSQTLVAPTVAASHDARSHKWEWILALMSAKKKLIETHLAATDLSEVVRPLIDDARWIEWYAGAPADGARSQGKTSYLRNFDDHNLPKVGTRMTEEDDGVVV